MNKEFIRVRSTKDITLSVILIVAGCVLACISVSTPINILGFFLILTGIALFFLMKTAYKDTETGAKYGKTERFFSQDQREQILRAISSKPDSANLAEEDKGNSVRLDIYHSKATGKAYIQLFEYIPYKYEPCSAIYEHEIKNAEKLIK